MLKYWWFCVWPRSLPWRCYCFLIDCGLLWISALYSHSLHYNALHSFIHASYHEFKLLQATRYLKPYHTHNVALIPVIIQLSLLRIPHRTARFSERRITVLPKFEFKAEVSSPTFYGGISSYFVVWFSGMTSEIVCFHLYWNSAFPTPRCPLKHQKPNQMWYLNRFMSASHGMTLFPFAPISGSWWISC